MGSKFKELIELALPINEHGFHSSYLNQTGVMIHQHHVTMVVVNCPIHYFG